MKRKIVSLVIGFTLLFGFTLGVGAAPVLEKISAHLNWTIKFSLDGKNWTPKDDKGNKLAPITYKNTTYLPVRAVSEAIGTSVNWDQKTQTIHLGERSGIVPITSEEMSLGAFAFSTIDKQYTVQNGKDYQSGIVFEGLNSASKSFRLLPKGKYQKVNLTLIALDTKNDIRIQIENKGTVLKDVTLSASQPTSTIELNIGGFDEISFTGKSALGSKENVLITGTYK
ncbi:stalk domain-containing protein [Cytobacillus sp. FJAT-53684]|uniref:Stalk domain-containing protein n=1 Tax=Cytobacillus mangrovibacter TaxID=3299024 RepID=A0ABW6JX10_9BACI